MKQRKKVGDSVALAVAAVGAIVVFGWFAGVDVLLSLAPDWVSMKFQTAASFMLSGVLVFIIRGNGVGPKSQYLGGACAMALILISTVFLWGAVFGVPTIEAVFVQESAERAILSARPGQPSIGTMAAFALIAASGVIWIFERRRPIRFLMMAVAMLGAIGVLGYAFSEPALYYYAPGISTAMAFHTAACFLALGIVGALSRVPGSGRINGGNE